EGEIAGDQIVEVGALAFGQAVVPRLFHRAEGAEGDGSVAFGVESACFESGGWARRGVRGGAQLQRGFDAGDAGFERVVRWSGGRAGGRGQESSGGEALVEEGGQRLHRVVFLHEVAEGDFLAEMPGKRDGGL